MKLVLPAAISLVSLALSGCAASTDTESDSVRVEVSDSELGSLGIDSACYAQCMDDRQGGDPVVFDYSATHENPYGIDPRFGAGSYRNADACYAQCQTTTGRTPPAPTRKFKLQK